MSVVQNNSMANSAGINFS